MRNATFRKENNEGKKAKDKRKHDKTQEISKMRRNIKEIDLEIVS